MKKVVDQLKTSQVAGRASSIPACSRPWGCYDAIDLGERFQVKRITVNPGASLSSQMHHHRAEHWVVVHRHRPRDPGEEEGPADRKSVHLHSRSGSVTGWKIPARLPLEIIEVQSGSYLGEDDIVRYDDAYGREECEAK